jgi:hypothetical protein
MDVKQPLHWDQLGSVVHYSRQYVLESISLCNYWKWPQHVCKTCQFIVRNSFSYICGCFFKLKEIVSLYCIAPHYFYYKNFAVVSLRHEQCAVVPSGQGTERGSCQCHHDGYHDKNHTK